MPVVVEYIGFIGGFPSYSFAHYGEQNGDLMRDPEMEFIKGPDGMFYPVSFRNDYAGAYTRSLELDGDQILGVYPKQQADQAEFANMWMRNILHQQGLCLD